jgi:hypothetical protein
MMKRRVNDEMSSRLPGWIKVLKEIYTDSLDREQNPE